MKHLLSSKNVESALEIHWKGMAGEVKLLKGTAIESIKALQRQILLNMSQGCLTAHSRFRDERDDCLLCVESDTKSHTMVEVIEIPHFPIMMFNVNFN